MPSKTRQTSSLQFLRGEKQTLIIEPQDDVLETSGNLVYKESSRAWSIIRLKKEFLKCFPALFDRMLCVQYKIIYPKSHEILQKIINEIVKNKQTRPMLLYFFKTKNQ